MSTTTRAFLVAAVLFWLTAFEALSPAEQQQVAAEILRRAAPADDLSAAGLEELAAELKRRRG